MPPKRSQTPTTHPATHEHATDVPEKKKKRRWKIGTVAKREIRKLSNSTKLQLPRATFIKVVKEISNEYKSALRWNGPAINALQDAAETYLTGMFQRAEKAREFRGSKTLTTKDLQYSLHMGSVEAGQEP